MSDEELCKVQIVAPGEAPFEKGDVIAMVPIEHIKALREAYKAIPEKGIVPKDIARWLQPLINACTTIVGSSKTDRLLTAGELVHTSLPGKGE